MTALWLRLRVALGDFPVTGAVPTYCTRKAPGAVSFGESTAELSAELGAPFMPWQTLTADLGLETTPAGLFTRKVVVITGPRQIGKTTLGRAVLVKKAALGRRAFQTAQTGKHARRRWLQATQGVEQVLNGGRRGRSTWSEQVVKRNIGVGTECLTWLSSGGTVEPFAPNEQGLHGESPDDVLIDEGQALSVESADLLQSAYSPAMSARPDPQEWLMSTKGTADSIWWASVVEAGRASVELGYATGMVYIEYSAPEVVNGIPIWELPDDVLLDVIWAHHPADGYTLNRDVVFSDLRDKVHTGRMSRSEFIRGYANVQSGGASVAGAWPAAVWRDAGTELAPIGQVGLGIDVDPDGREWALVAAGHTGGDRVVVEVLERGDGQPGVRQVQLVRDVIAAQEVVGIQTIGSGAAADFADLLTAAGVEVERLPTLDLAAAVSRMKSGVEQKRILHRDQPSLSDAQKAARQRETTDRRYWARSGSAPIATLQAATVAVWALDHPSIVTGPFQMFVPRSA